ncbi:MAG TPA: peptide MFS transporter [Phycisphaerales bacterium]|nr:peptide MFS transporter [Phycisphaerales bacterium]
MNDDQSQAMSADEAIEAANRSQALGHPKGLFLLFLVEMWERFSYYGMRGLLVLYLVSVVAIHQLTPGVHSNTLEIAEMSGDRDATVVATTVRDIHVLVGDGFTAPGVNPAPTGSPSLRLQRLSLTPSPEAESEASWEIDSSDTGSPVVVRGPQGGTSDRSTRGFDHPEFRFALTNPTEQPVKVRLSIRRDGPDARTFFRVNNTPGSGTAEIKPDLQRAEDERPFEVVVRANTHDSGRNWLRSDASVLYGWYAGLAYLFPILGGIIADKLIGTHRSMLIGGLLITIGHIILGVSGFGEMALSRGGMSLFVVGLAVIVLGTGHFKPTVSVMVGQLYRQGDPRRDAAFTIFYMGINLGAFLCAFVCGTLGEEVGWHYGFGSAAVGMILGLLLYIVGKPRLLPGIGNPPPSAATKANSASMLFLLGSLVVAGLFGLAYHEGLVAKVGELITYLQRNPALGWGVVAAMTAGALAWALWFLSINRIEDRGPVITIFVFMIFNAFFWIAFEQAGSSLNLFTEANTERMIGTFQVPATWFQSVNAGLIFMLAPLFAVIWTRLGAINKNPSQPLKIALGLIFLGIGYIFMVVAGQITVGGAAKASMFFVLACYFWHTVGELCLSPTGLSYVTKAAPVKFVSLLMGIWFISSFIANLGGGLIASLVEDVESGKIKTPWNFGGQADFFFLFVVTSIGAGLVVLALTPMLKKLMRPGTG